MKNFRTLNWNNRSRKLTSKEVDGRSPSPQYMKTVKSRLMNRNVKIVPQQIEF